jgi:hypothetical protein
MENGLPTHLPTHLLMHLPRPNYTHFACHTQLSRLCPALVDSESRSGTKFKNWTEWVYMELELAKNWIW